jgi:hypothetical protein
MKRLTAKQIATQIKRNNAKFKKATDAQKRVLIAKDVLARVASRQYRVQAGQWIALGTWFDRRREPAQNLLLEGETCAGCALGGLMMSCTVFNNKMVTDNFQHYDIGRKVKSKRPIPNGLNTFFSNEQLRLIETAFEKGLGFDGWGRAFNNSAQAEAAVAFGSRFRGERTRLLAIMRNIVKNKGTFKP